MLAHKWLTTALTAILIAAPLKSADTSSFALREPRYRLEVSDVVAIQFRLSPEFNGNITVQPDGFGSLPMLGDVKLSGLTMAEAAEVIKQKAAERLSDPEVTLQLVSFDPPHFIVGGEVTNPGRFDLRSPITVLRAVQLAGGLKPSARSSQVILVRPINAADAETKIINLKHAQKAYTVAEDIQLKPGDLVIVPTSRIANLQNISKLVNWGLYFNPTTF